MWHPQAEITPENQRGIFRSPIFFQESGKLSSHLIDQGDVVVVPRRVFSCGYRVRKVVRDGVSNFGRVALLVGSDLRNYFCMLDFSVPSLAILTRLLIVSDCAFAFQRFHLTARVHRSPLI